MKKFIILLNILILSGCDFIPFKSTHQVGISAGESFEEKQKIGISIASAMRSSNLAYRVQQKLPGFDLLTLQNQVKVNVLLKNQKTVFVQCVVTLPMKANKIAMEICKKRGDVLSKLNIGGKTYTKNQVRKYLNDTYNDHSKPNISLWNSFTKDITYVINLNSKLFPEGTLVKDKSVVSALEFIDKVTKRYAQAANMNFTRGSSPADFTIIISSNFQDYKNDSVVRYVDLGNNYTEQDIINRNNEWNSFDVDGSKKSFRAGYSYFVENGSKNNQILQGYSITRADNAETEGFARRVSAAVCTMLTGQSGVSSSVGDSCGSQSRIANSDNEKIDFDNVEKYIYPFDLALIEVLYKNPQISSLKREDAIEEILKNLMDK